MGIWQTILNLIFPSSCFVCGREGTELCLSCLADSPPAERECAEWIYPLYDYRNPNIKKAVWLLKYKNKRGIAITFAEAMYGRILEELGDIQAMENFTRALLVPIPLSGARLRERRFNQTELMARTLVHLDENKKNFELADTVLKKPRETEHQAWIENKSQRMKNVTNSFAVQNSEKIKSRNIILLDDVTTTGATLSEAKKVLREAGARKVVAFTLAH